MEFDRLFPRSYMSKDDCTPPARRVIHYITQEVVGTGENSEEKPVMYFEGEDVKPMVLNRENAATLATAFGKDVEEWYGKEIEIYVDPSVKFRDRKVGGLRVRIPKAPAPSKRSADKAGDSPKG